MSLWSIYFDSLRSNAPQNDMEHGTWFWCALISMRLRYMTFCRVSASKYMALKAQQSLINPHPLDVRVLIVARMTGRATSTFQQN